MNGTGARLEKCWWQKNNIKLSTRLTFTHLPRRPPFGEKYSITMRLCAAPEKKNVTTAPIHICRECSELKDHGPEYIFVCKIIPSCIGIKAFSSAAAAGRRLTFCCCAKAQRAPWTFHQLQAQFLLQIIHAARRTNAHWRRRVLKQEIRGLLHLERDDRSVA